MPLRIHPISSRATKGQILGWLLDTDEIKKPQVGVIAVQGRMAAIDVPEPAGRRLAARLDGRILTGRSVQVWFEPDADDTEGADHFMRLERWLDMESKAEAEQARAWREAAADHDSSTGLKGLVVRGEDTGLGGYQLLSLGRRRHSHPLPATRLKVGVPVLVTLADGQGKEQRRGVVTSLEPLQLEVALTKPFSVDSDDAEFRVDAADDEVAMERCRVSLARARTARGDRTDELRAALLGLRAPAFDTAQELRPLNPDLNDTQREAVAFALAARDVAVIHGPPGTGKTTAVVELIRQAVQRGDKVLACAPSNLGVDNIFERLVDAGEAAVRLGHPVRVLPHLRDRTIMEAARKHPSMRQVKKLRTQAKDLFRKAERSSRAGMDRAARQELRSEAKSLLTEARATEADVVEEVLAGADVVCATNTGLDATLLGARRFGLAVIDEACQSTEPSCWIPLLRADRVVLAGDHCQLPPTVISQPAAGEGFAVSLQERLVQQSGDDICRPLLTQYRMHEEIMMFSSAEFYEGRLVAHASVAGHRLCDLPDVDDEELTATAVHFIDTSGAGYDDERESAGSSVLNREEARLAAKKARELVAMGVRPEAIAVITPYTAQVGCLREQLDESAIEIGTIDGFQGREKEAVIISLVRSNPDKEVGFLKDTRRMNVALTRARRKLIVIGDSATISAHPFYARLLDHFDLVDGYHVVWEEE